MRMAKVQFGGISKRICLKYVPEAQVGDYILCTSASHRPGPKKEEAKRVFEMLQGIGAWKN